MFVARQSDFGRLSVSFTPVNGNEYKIARFNLKKHILKDILMEIMLYDWKCAIDKEIGVVFVKPQGE